MANVLVDENSLKDIADAIRTKNGTQTKYKPSQMADAIEAISGGGIIPSGTIQIASNGTVDVTNYASAEVNVPTSGTTPTGTKQISITENGTTTEDIANYASAEIVVNVPSSGGGATMASGTFISTAAKTISVPVSFQPSHFICKCKQADETTDSVWKTVGVIYDSDDTSSCWKLHRYGASNINAARFAATVSYSNGTFTISGFQYDLQADTTYYWYAW